MPQTYKGQIKTDKIKEAFRGFLSLHENIMLSIIAQGETNTVHFVLISAPFSLIKSQYQTDRRPKRNALRRHIQAKETLMNILLAGGTGSFGRAFLDHLSQAGHSGC